MPKTSYALLKGIRSHRITSPTQEPSRSQAHDPPLACTLCHTDRSRAWLEQQLAPFLQRPTPLPDPQATTLPWAVEQALTGDAALRAVLLFALASPEALQTAGRAPFDVVQNQLQNDSYAAIRHMARRLAQHIEQRSGTSSHSEHTPLPSISPELLRRLLENQDQTPIVISE